ncbi:MAG: hypothetical protein JO272_03415 [Pseudonocardiales bacterium]|nr:hypothetical protein [Pseudonocardiales bacterium]
MNETNVEPQPADQRAQLLAALREVNQQMPSIVIAAINGTLTKESQFKFGHAIID